ncbi:hypothetical protein [Streptomyces sp. NPDC091416]|uniref:hypothetical protein n=1 Tax=Streptomyces sp. NPDC091416 TaxID=3366003 RepID=UPI0037FFF148
MDLSPAQEAVFEKAKARVSHRLTFGKTSQSRGFLATELLGPAIPDAFKDGAVQAGEWQQTPEFCMNGQTLEEPTEQHWLGHCLSMAINEAVHEALEHFQVDGQPYLNPHGKSEALIYIHVNQLAAQLAELAEEEESA